MTITMSPLEVILFIIPVFVNCGTGFILGMTCGESSDASAVTKMFHRVMGGSSSTPGQWPWQVVINENGDFECSGVIINQRWVLTVAHCFDTGVWGQLESKYRVITGEYNLKEVEGREITHNISSIIAHPQFNSVTGEHDIALIKLSSPVRYNHFVSPVCLPSTKSVYKGKNCIVSGWGETKNTDSPNVLRWVTVPVIGHSECQRDYPRHFRAHIYPTNICAGSRSKDSCSGDSGGPLVCLSDERRWEVAGLVSWGKACGSPEPGVYTRVQSYLPWINETIRTH